MPEQLTLVPVEKLVGSGTVAAAEGDGAGKLFLA
jgi:hypothetical protein